MALTFTYLSGPERRLLSRSLVGHPPRLPVRRKPPPLPAMREPLPRADVAPRRSVPPPLPPYVSR
jgi:hypothetical protein